MFFVGCDKQIYSRDRQENKDRKIKNVNDQDRKK